MPVLAVAGAADVLLDSAGTRRRIDSLLETGDVRHTRRSGPIHCWHWTRHNRQGVPELRPILNSTEHQSNWMQPPALSASFDRTASNRMSAGGSPPALIRTRTCGPHLVVNS